VTRTLILMRHAKSAWPMGVRDLDRPLNERGRAAAVRSGAWIAANAPTPGRVAVSPAMRTRQTWDLVREQLARQPDDFEFQPLLYAGSWWDSLDVIRSSRSSESTVMLIGHNPNTETLADQLTATGDPGQLRKMRSKFPTAAVAVLTSDTPWSRWGSECAELLDYFTPRRTR